MLPSRLVVLMFSWSLLRVWRWQHVSPPRVQIVRLRKWRLRSVCQEAAGFIFSPATTQFTQLNLQVWGEDHEGSENSFWDGRTHWKPLVSEDETVEPLSWNYSLHLQAGSVGRPDVNRGTWNFQHFQPEAVKHNRCCTEACWAQIITSLVFICRGLQKVVFSHFTLQSHI